MMATATAKETIQNAGAMAAALRELFPSPTFAMFFEVPNGTGMTSTRAIDALVMGCWPSRGLDLCAVEIKVDRGDWLRELKDPLKAEEIAKFCDGFYLAVGDASIVRDGEVPTNWGLIAPRGKKLSIIKAAPKLQPLPMTRKFLASVFRASCESGTRGVEERIRKARWDGIEEGKKSAETSAESRRKNAEDTIKELEGRISKFENDSGIRIDGIYADTRYGPNWANAVKFVRDGGVESVPKKILEAEHLARDLAAAVERYKSAVAQVEP